MTTTEPKYRYPGIRPFSTGDTRIFHGRHTEVEKLYDLLATKRMIVMFAPSGMGKSSLVNAGLIPKCEEEYLDAAFTPITIRFGTWDGVSTNKDLLLQKVLQKMAQHKKEIKILPFSQEEEETSLWYQAKLMERNGQILLLIFDQSEELFTYQEDQVNFLKKELSCLFSSAIPKHYDANISDFLKEKREPASDREMKTWNEDLEFIYKPLQSKVLFVIREDQLSCFNVFSDSFPDILKNIFRLGPLSQDGAIDAIEQPAKQEGTFDTPGFEYSKEAVAKFLNTLKKDTDSGYDPFSIQLTCRYVEQAVAAQKIKKLPVTEKDIPDAGKVETDYIRQVWKETEKVAGREIHNVKKAIVTNLIDIKQEKRVSKSKGDWLDEKVQIKLLEEGLIKPDRRGGVDYLELSHDRLVRPLIDEFVIDNRLREKHKTQNVLIGTIISIIILVTGAYFKEMKNDEYVLADAKKTIADTYQKELTDSVRELQLKTKALIAYNNIPTADHNSTNVPVAASAGLSDSEKQLDTLVREKYNKALMRVDIFYPERVPGTMADSKSAKTLYADQIADQLFEILQAQPNFIVRKRQLAPVKSPSSKYAAYRNEIRYNDDENEASVALEIQLLVNSKFSSDNLLFTRQPITYKTPNYISIFLKNTEPPADNGKGK